jgi:hypothetical protein
MATNIDAAPISTQRIRRTSSINVMYDSAGALFQVIATRATTVQQAGVDITAPIYTSFVVLAAQVPAAIATQLAALATRIDQVDNAP